MGEQRRSESRDGCLEKKEWELKGEEEEVGRMGPDVARRRCSHNPLPRPVGVSDP